MIAFSLSSRLQHSILLLFFASTASAKNQGCYDANPLSCDTPHANPIKLDFSLEDICSYLQVEFFRTHEIASNVSLHKSYLNLIDADSQLCSQIQLAYSQCFFCADNDFQRQCVEDAMAFSCGNVEELPSLATVLWSNEDELYERFRTERDIQDTCKDLKIAASQPQPFSFPSTIDLCKRQERVKHLCPGVCDGTCFESYDLSCNPQDYKGPVNATLDNFGMCDEIQAKAFHNAPIEDLLNISQHPKYLRAIPEMDGDYSFCNNARQAYSHCSWCADSLCFNEDHPPSCDSRLESTSWEGNTMHVDRICHDIYWALFDIDFPEDLYDTSQQVGKILMPEDTVICDHAREVYHKCYWCAQDVPLDFCNEGTMCSSNVTIPNEFVPHNLQSWLHETTESPEVYCDEIWERWNQSFWPYSMQSCYEEIYLARLCPDHFCPRPKPQSYFGATTTVQKTALVWASRGAAILALCGAFYVLYDILTDSKAPKMVYYQLLIGMAIFDIITALAWCLSTFPVPQELAGHVEGAMGSEATCTAQAFFVQFGFTSVFYNVSLSVYYVLVIAFNWRENHLKTIRVYLLSFPLLIGLGLALGAIPSYHWMEFGCHLMPPPNGEFWPVVGFVLLPLGLSIIVITESVIVVYWAERKRRSSSEKWILVLGKASALESMACWQCLLYALAFYISWPILLVIYLGPLNGREPLYLTMTVACLAPLQGFTNFLVYLRPKLFKSESEASQEGMDPSAALALHDVVLDSKDWQSATKRSSEAIEDGMPNSIKTRDESPSMLDSEKSRGGSSSSLEEEERDEFEDEFEIEEDPDFDWMSMSEPGSVMTADVAKQASCGPLDLNDCKISETVEQMMDVFSDSEDGTVNQSDKDVQILRIVDAVGDSCGTESKAFPSQQGKHNRLPVNRNNSSRMEQSQVKLGKTRSFSSCTTVKIGTKGGQNGVEARKKACRVERLMPLLPEDQPKRKPNQPKPTLLAYKHGGSALLNTPISTTIGSDSENPLSAEFERQAQWTRSRPHEADDAAIGPKTDLIFSGNGMQSGDSDRESSDSGVVSLGNGTTASTKGLRPIKERWIL